MSIEETIKKAYEHMDPKTGMFPADWTCRVCGKVLNADGNHPAEIYAGSFTGLCYACERGNPYVVPGSELPDGARRVSHPPACPSWRRDRTEHWGYPDCEECKGQGAKRRYSWNGDYMEFCRPCMARVSKPRKENEVEFLRAVALHLEQAPMTVQSKDGMTEAQATVSVLCTSIAKVVGIRWSQTLSVWRPRSYLLNEAESRLTKAQLGAKRPDTLRRHLVAALRAQADELQSTI